jgi:uncharacterized protein (DUF983 family)
MRIINDTVRVRSALTDMSRGLCPRCRIGPIFEGRAFPRYPGIARVHHQCTICGLRFHREQGYFLGAMYFSYAMVVAIVIISLAVLSLLTGWHWKVKFAIALAVVLALTPPMVTISRVLWIWFDRKIDPGGP